MSDMDRALNVIEGLRIGTCWCGKGIDNPNYTRHTGTCQGAVQLLKAYDRIVPKEAESL